MPIPMLPPHLDSSRMAELNRLIKEQAHESPQQPCGGPRPGYKDRRRRRLDETAAEMRARATEMRVAELRRRAAEMRERKRQRRRK
jgi:hypothetical protein